MLCRAVSSSSVGSAFKRYRADMFVVNHASNATFPAVPFVPSKTKVFTPFTFVERTNQILAGAGVGALSSSAAMMIAGTHAKATAHRFHEILRGGLASASGVIALARVVPKFVVGKVAKAVLRRGFYK